MWVSSIAFGVFLVTFLVTLNVAAYAMYRELETENTSLKARLHGDVSTVNLCRLLVKAEKRIREVIEQGRDSERKLQGASGEEMPGIQAQHAQKVKDELLTVIEETANKPLRDARHRPLDIDAIVSTNNVREMYRLGADLIEELEATRSALSAGSGLPKA